MLALAAISAAIGWGLGGFLGGFASRRASPVVVVICSQAFSLLLLICVWPWLGRDLPGATFALLSVATGGLNAVSLLLINRAYVTGPIVHAAPVLALAPIVPFAYGLLTGESPHAAQIAGAFLAVSGTVLLATAEKSGGPMPAARGQLLFVTLGAIAFGVVLIGMGEISRQEPYWSLVGLRVGAVTMSSLVILAWPASARPARDWETIALIGVMSVIDVLSVALFGLAVRNGQISLAAVLGSMFPVVTALFSVVLLGERLDRKQILAYAVAFAGAALIVVG